jgi:hypothetical protein
MNLFVNFRKWLTFSGLRLPCVLGGPNIWITNADDNLLFLCKKLAVHQNMRLDVGAS